MCVVVKGLNTLAASHDVDSNLSVLEQQFMGDHCRYVIEANGQKLLATSSRKRGFVMPVTVKVDTKGVLAF
ncbi:hypothetical protein O9992_05855 [Vibrio lentus]|nr:hypothetical protein [Vibrio lentus]